MSARRSLVRWYQREIGAFNAGLGYGVIAYARGRRQEAFVGSWAVSAVLLAITRAAALISGERRGIRNVATVMEDAALGLGALALLTPPPPRRIQNDAIQPGRQHLTVTFAM